MTCLDDLEALDGPVVVTAHRSQEPDATLRLLPRVARSRRARVRGDEEQQRRNGEVKCVNRAPGRGTQ